MSSFSALIQSLPISLPREREKLQGQNSFKCGIERKHIEVRRVRRFKETSVAEDAVDTQGQT